MKARKERVPMSRLFRTTNLDGRGWVNQRGYTTFPYISHKWKTEYVVYSRSTQALYWMPKFGLGEPKRIHNTFLNQLVNVKETKYDIYPRSTQALHRMPGLLPGWTTKDTQHFPILTMNEKLSMLYIPEALRHLMLNARTSAWLNQKGYTTFPFIDH